MSLWKRLMGDGRSNLQSDVDTSLSLALNLQTSLPSPKLLKRMIPMTSPWGSVEASMEQRPQSSPLLMKGEVKAWEMTAERLRSRTLEAANHAASLKQQAWSKDSQSTWASARAAELEAEAAGCRIRGDLGGALRTIQEANRLHDESDEAAEEAEALQAEAKQKESEAEDASRRAIDAISRSALLGAANANKEAKEAEEKAVVSRQAYSELLSQLGMAMKQLEDARAWQVESAERLRDAQMSALASRLGGGPSSEIDKDDAEEERLRREDVKKASALVASLERQVRELNEKMQEAQGTESEASQLDLCSSSSIQAGSQKELIERFEGLAKASFDAARTADEARQDLHAQAKDMRIKAEAFRSSIHKLESQGLFDEADAALATLERLETSRQALESNCEAAEQEMHKQTSIHQHLSNVLSILKGESQLPTDFSPVDEDVLGAVLADDILAAYSTASISALVKMKERVDSLLADYPDVDQDELNSLSPHLISSLSAASSLIQNWSKRTEGESEVRRMHALHHIQQLAGKMTDLKHSIVSLDPQDEDSKDGSIDLSSAAHEILLTPLPSHLSTSTDHIQSLAPRAIQYELEDKIYADEKEEEEEEEILPTHPTPSLKPQVFLTDPIQAASSVEEEGVHCASIASDSTTPPHEISRRGILAIIARQPLRGASDEAHQHSPQVHFPSDLFKAITSRLKGKDKEAADMPLVKQARADGTLSCGPSDDEIAASDSLFALMLQRRENLARTLISLSAFATALEGECKALSHEANATASSTNPVETSSSSSLRRLLFEKQLAEEQSNLLSAQLDATIIGLDHQKRRHACHSTLSHLERSLKALISLSSNALGDARRLETQAVEEEGRKARTADDLALFLSSVSGVKSNVGMRLVESSELLLLASTLRANAVKMRSKAVEARKKHLKLKSEADAVEARISELKTTLYQQERLASLFTQEADAWAHSSLLHGLKGGLKLRSVSDDASNAPLALLEDLIGSDMDCIAQEIIQIDKLRQLLSTESQELAVLIDRGSLALRAALDAREKREDLAEAIVTSSSMVEGLRLSYDLSSASFQAASLSFSALSKSMEMDESDDLAPLYQTLGDLFLDAHHLHTATVPVDGSSIGAREADATKEVATLLQESIRHLMSALQIAEDQGLDSIDSLAFLRAHQMYQQALEKLRAGLSYEEDAQRARQQAKREAAYCKSHKDDEEACTLARLHQTVLLRVAPDLDELAKLTLSESRLIADAAGLLSSEGYVDEVERLSAQASEMTSKVIRLKEHSAPRARAATAIGRARDLQCQSIGNPSLSWAAQVSAHQAMTLVAFSNISNHLNMSDRGSSSTQGTLTRAQCMAALLMVDSQLAACSIELSQSLSSAASEAESAEQDLSMAKDKVRCLQDTLSKSRSSRESMSAMESWEVSCESARLEIEIDKISRTIVVSEKLLVDVRGSETFIRKCFEVARQLSTLVESARDQIVNAGRDQDLPSSVAELISNFCSTVDSAMNAIGSCSSSSLAALHCMKEAMAQEQAAEVNKREATAYGALAGLSSRDAADNDNASLIMDALEYHEARHQQALKRSQQELRAASQALVCARAKADEAKEAKEKAAKVLDNLSQSISRHHSLAAIFKAPLESFDEDVNVMRTPGPMKSNIDRGMANPAPPPTMIPASTLLRSPPPPPPPPLPPPPSLPLPQPPQAHHPTSIDLPISHTGDETALTSDIKRHRIIPPHPDSRLAPLPGNVTPWQISILFKLWKQKLAILTGIREYERPAEFLASDQDVNNKMVVQALAMVERLAMLGGSDAPLYSHLHALSNAEAAASIADSLSGLPVSVSPSSTCGAGDIIAKHLGVVKSIQAEMKALAGTTHQRAKEARSEAESLQRLADNRMRLCDQLRDTTSNGSISVNGILKPQQSLSISALKVQRVAELAREAFEQRAEMHAEAQTCDEESIGIESLVGQADGVVTLFRSAARCEGEAFRSQLDTVDAAISTVLASSHLHETSDPRNSSSEAVHWTRMDSLAQQSLAKYSEASSLIQKALREERRLANNLHGRLADFASGIEARVKNVEAYSAAKSAEAAEAKAKSNRATLKSRALSQQPSTSAALEDAAKRWSQLADSCDSASSAARRRSVSLADAATLIRRLISKASNSLQPLQSNRAAAVESGGLTRYPIEAYAERSALQLLTSTRLLAQASLLASRTTQSLSATHSPSKLPPNRSSPILKIGWHDQSTADDALRMISHKIDQAETRIRDLRSSIAIEAVKGSSSALSYDARRELMIEYESDIPRKGHQLQPPQPYSKQAATDLFIPLTIKAAGKTALAQLSTPVHRPRY